MVQPDLTKDYEIADQVAPNKDEKGSKRTAWVEDEEEWYFSAVDVVRVLTEQPDTDGARNYWKVLKNRIKEEGNELVTNCNQLKMKAQFGRERIEELIDP